MDVRLATTGAERRPNPPCLNEYIGNASKIFTFEDFKSLFNNEEDMRQLYICTFMGDIFAIEVPDEPIEVI